MTQEEFDEIFESLIDENPLSKMDNSEVIVANHQENWPRIEARLEEETLEARFVAVILMHTIYLLFSQDYLPKNYTALIRFIDDCQHSDWATYGLALLFCYCRHEMTKEAEDCIIGFLFSENVDLQEISTQIVGNLALKGAVVHLSQFLNDDNKDLAESAKYALEYIGTDSALYALHQANS